MYEISNTKWFDHFFQVTFVLFTFGNILFNYFSTTSRNIYWWLIGKNIHVPVSLGYQMTHWINLAWLKRAESHNPPVSPGGGVCVWRP